MDDSGLTPAEFCRARAACRWVRVTAALLPFLKPFLARRLAAEHALALKVARLDRRQAFRLWERLK